MDRTFVAIGGGSLRERTTLQIDEYIVSLAKKEKPEALFVPTASHNSKPYFNTFRKVYGSILKCHCDVALVSTGEMSLERIAEKINKADIIYVGSGDTKFLLDTWRDTGLDKLIIEAYRRGVILCGLSAGAIYPFEYCYSDYDLMRTAEYKMQTDGEYKVIKGLGLIKGIACPHYNLRPEFDKVRKNYETSYAIKDNEKLVFINEKHQ